MPHTHLVWVQRLSQRPFQGADLELSVCSTLNALPMSGAKLSDLSDPKTLSPSGSPEHLVYSCQGPDLQGWSSIYHLSPTQPHILVKCSDILAW